MTAVPNANAGLKQASDAVALPAVEERNALRTLFGVVLFVGWGLLTFVWLASTVYLAVHGRFTPALTAASAVALLLLLGAMEGLEVSVIDRWQQVFPGRPPSYLAGWLSARQLFVAFIVTAATLLANRPVLVFPGTSVHIRNGAALGVFDLAWTTLTVLWFAQIFWKHLGATNPDRYLYVLKGALFPIVQMVHTIGISQPGEWTAVWVEDRIVWPASVDELKQRPPAEHKLTHAEIWRELHRHPRPPAVR
jgi:hypothetical protein